MCLASLHLFWNHLFQNGFSCFIFVYQACIERQHLVHCCDWDGLLWLFKLNSITLSLGQRDTSQVISFISIFHLHFWFIQLSHFPLEPYFVIMQTLPKIMLAPNWRPRVSWSYWWPFSLEILGTTCGCSFHYRGQWFWFNIERSWWFGVWLHCPMDQAQVL